MLYSMETTTEKYPGGMAFPPIFLPVTAPKWRSWLGIPSWCPENSLRYSCSSWENLTQGTQIDFVKPGVTGTAPGSQRAVILRGTLSS